MTFGVGVGVGAGSGTGVGVGNGSTTDYSSVAFPRYVPGTVFAAKVKTIVSSIVPFVVFWN